jgi:hypothetical protein
VVARKKLTKKEVHVQRYFDAAKRRAIAKNLPFGITLEYLRSIAGDCCPIFHTNFKWGRSGLGRGKFHDSAPQLDRIVPELGYVVGNVAFISHRANRIKDNGTMQEHYDIADWIWDLTVAKTKPTTLVSKRDRVALEITSEPRAIPRARPWENSDNTNHHRRTIPRDDIGDRTKAGGGNGVGHGGK